MDALYAYLRKRQVNAFPTPWEPFTAIADRTGANHVQFLEAAMGGAVLAVSQQFKPRGPLELERVRRQLDDVVQRGLNQGLGALAEQWTLRAKMSTNYAAEIQGMIRAGSGEED